MTVLNKYQHGNRKPPDAVNIMRGTQFGNPFIVGRDGDRLDVVEKFRQYLRREIKRRPEFRKAVRSLHGKDLYCCCAPLPCHGDVLEAVAAELNEF